MQELIKDYIAKKKKDPEISIEEWLDKAADQAKQLCRATHILKFTNGDAKGTNIYSVEDKTENPTSSCYVTTSSLNNFVFDIAVKNAATLAVAGLVQLELNSVTLLEMVAKDDGSAFEGFTDSKEKIQKWIKGLKAILNNEQLSSHSLAKQIYFPLENGTYHLLSPLYASSLSHALYEKIKESKFGEEAKIAREKKKKDEHSDWIIEDFPQLAIQSFGGTQPQNISVLNSKRNGKVYLLRSVPPIWKDVSEPPKRENSFWREFERRNFSEISELRRFLIDFQSRRNNSSNRETREEHLNCIIDSLLGLAREIQQFPSGWSKESKLVECEKIWLDPEREEYQELQTLDEWKEKVAKRFARWLATVLNSKQDTFELEDDEVRHIESICLQALKEVTL